MDEYERPTRRWVIFRRRMFVVDITNVRVVCYSYINQIKQIALFECTNQRKVGNVTDLGNLFMDHKSKNTKHGSTSIVQFNGTLLKLGFFIKIIPSVINVSVTEISNEFISSSWYILHEGNLKESDEADDLSNSSEWNGISTTDGG